MKLLALVESQDHVCCRYRIRPFEPALARHGIRLHIQGLAKSPWDRVKQLIRAAKADGVLLQRKLLPIWQLILLRRRAKRVIYDVDDALFHRDSYHPKGQESWDRLLRFWATVYAADVVLAGNRFLRDQVSRYIGPRRVHQMPTCVDTRGYPLAEHRGIGSEAKLVWVGLPRNLPSLNYIQEHLAQAAQQVPGLSLRLICDRFPALKGIQVLPYRWSADVEVYALAEADIGICWLPDDTWSLGKCGLKVLQYMAAGLPVVANPVGIHRELVQPGKTGFLAETPAEWAQAIERLANSPQLRREMGRAARLFVEQHYDVGQWAPRWAEVVAEVLLRSGMEEDRSHQPQSYFTEMVLDRENVLPGTPREALPKVVLIRSGGGIQADNSEEEEPCKEKVLSNHLPKSQGGTTSRQHPLKYFSYTS